MPRTELRMNSNAEEDVTLADGIAHKWRLQEGSKLTKKITLALSNFLAVSETEQEHGEISCSKLACQTIHRNSDRFWVASVSHSQIFPFIFIVPTISKWKEKSLGLNGWGPVTRRSGVSFIFWVSSEVWTFWGSPKWGKIWKNEH